MVELLKIIDGDVIYASKPLLTSFGIGLIKKRITRKPIILDIDDWQMGIIRDLRNKLPFMPRLTYLFASLLFVYKASSYWNNLIGENLTFMADEIVVSNTFLKNKFGGTLIWHGRDTLEFDPSKFDKNQIRSKNHIKENKKVVMFLGTPRQHKGLEDLIEAVKMLNDPNIILAIVGLDPNDHYSSGLNYQAKKELKTNYIGFGLQPFSAVPEFMAMADVVVIPQKKNIASMGQIPAKIFDAMAMGKPIIATAVSDMPEILNNCGWITEPDNPSKLSDYIRNVLENPVLSRIMGDKARKKCIENYSWVAMEKILVGVFRKYEYPSQ
jgi:glycosyltransferase involved in cell wall biosynthesis